IQREDMVVTVTHSGYIKRVPLAAYRAQRRGGKGRAGMATRDEDALTTVLVTSTHTPLLFFSTMGQVYRLKVWKLPEGGPQARGRPLINLLPLAQGESISAILALPEDEESWANLHVMFATARGNVRRNSMADFTNVPTSGKIAIRFEDGSDDRLVGVRLCSEDDDVLLAARGGKCIRFPVTDVRVFKGRTSTGVRGMRLDNGDEVIALSTLRSFAATTEERDAYLRAAPWKSDPAPPTLPAERMAAFAANEQFILTVTANGFGKRSSAFEYRTASRGGSGIVNIETSPRNGHVVASGPVENNDQLLLMTDQGKLIRTNVDEIRIAGRATQGVTLFKVAEGEHVVSVAKIEDARIEEAGTSVGEGESENEGESKDDAPPA
ncbi:MAG: DNA gyrase subunit A, partial [Alphaproteobacteria bacterium]